MYPVSKYRMRDDVVVMNSISAALTISSHVTQRRWTEKACSGDTSRIMLSKTS